MRGLASTVMGIMAMVPLYALGADAAASDARSIGPVASVAQVGALGWMVVEGLKLAKGWQAALVRREDIDARIVRALERIAERQGHREDSERHNLD